MYLNLYLLYLQYLSDGGERREGTGHKFASDGKGVLGCGGDSSGSGVHRQPRRWRPQWRMSVELSAVMGPMVMTAAMAAATVVARMRAAAMAAAMAVRVVANVVAAHNGSQSFPSPLCGTC